MDVLDVDGWEFFLIEIRWMRALFNGDKRVPNVYLFLRKVLTGYNIFKWYTTWDGLPTPKLKSNI